VAKKHPIDKPHPLSRQRDEQRRRERAKRRRKLRERGPGCALAIVVIVVAGVIAGKRTGV
jgi:hypothetical protein